jgi:hypothetical protein
MTKSSPLPQAGAVERLSVLFGRSIPHPEFVEESIRGNEQMAEKKQFGQAEPRENPVGPELWDSTSRGK